MNKVFINIILLSSLLFAGCNQNGNKLGSADDRKEQTGRIFKPEYASGFIIEELSGGYLLRLFNPWESGRILREYWIGYADSVPPNLDAVFIPFRASRIAISSTTHAGFMVALGQVDRLVGSTNPERLFDEKLIQRYKTGRLQNLGRDMDFNLEALLNAEPDLIFQTAFEGQITKDKALLTTGIPILYIQEWMESSPLGRAEWIKVVGLVTGQMELADSLFRKIEVDYCRLSKLIDPNSPKIKVVSGNNFKGTWFIPGGLNFMSILYKDAGMTQPWDTTQIQGSLPLSFETVFNELEDAEVWIGVNVRTGDELASQDARYELFDAYKNHQVYSVFGKVNAQGINDFWESGVVFPNRVLADLIYISHPLLLPDHQLLYYHKLIEW